MLHMNGRRRHHHIAYYRGPPPSLSNPVAWFEFANYPRNDGMVTQEQILNTIYAELRPINSTQRLYLRTRMQDAWPKFDPNHHLHLTKGEFVQCGIVPFISNLQNEFLRLYKPYAVEKPEKAKSHRMSMGKPPKLSAGREWFRHYDTTNDKLLSQEEVTQGIFETFKVKSDVEKGVIRDTIERAWPVFDDDYSGEIDQWEFLVKGGLHDYLILLESEWKERPKDRTSKHFLNISFKAGRRHTITAPPTLSDPVVWFQHFDFDHSGILREKEAINGLYATLNAKTSIQRQAVRHFVTQIWDDEQETITLEEFMKDGGYASKFQEFEADFHKQFDENEIKDDVHTGDVKIKVQIPKDKKPGDVIMVCSPKTQENVILLVPDKILWGGGGSEPYYFLVKF